MSRTRDAWKAALTSVGLGYPIHFPALPHVVTVRAELERDGREIVIELAPADAEALGRSLLERATKVRALNAG